MRPPHLAPSAASRKLSELGVRGVFASLFDQRPSSPKATRGRVRTPKVPRLRDETQRRVAPLENISAVEARKKIISLLSQRLLDQPVLSVRMAGHIPRGRRNS